MSRIRQVPWTFRLNTAVSSRPGIASVSRGPTILTGIFRYLSNHGRLCAVFIFQIRYTKETVKMKKSFNSFVLMWMKFVKCHAWRSDLISSLFLSVQLNYLKSEIPTNKEVIYSIRGVIKFDFFRFDVFSQIWNMFTGALLYSWLLCLPISVWNLSWNVPPEFTVEVCEIVKSSDFSNVLPAVSPKSENYSYQKL